MKLNKFAPLICVVALSGCMTASDAIKTPLFMKESAEKTGNVLKTREPIYGLLEESESGYQFVKFRVGDAQPTREPWVNFQSARPAWNTSSARCGKGLIKDRNNTVPDCSEVVSRKLFMASNFDEGDAAIRVAGAVFTMGLTLTGVSYDVNFDEDRWSKAYKQAFNRLDKDTLSLLDSELSSMNAMRFELSENYKSAVSAIDETVKIKVVDRSGLYNGNIEFREFVNYKPHRLNRAPTIETTSLDSALKEIKELRNELEVHWKLATAEIIVRCPSSSQAQNFEFELKCPATLPVKKGIVSGDIVVNVNSRNFELVFPKSYRAKDSRLYLELDSGQLNIANRTSRFVTVNSIAIYHNGKITTRKNLDIELAPQSELPPNGRPRLKDFSLSEEVLRFDGVTKNSALRTPLTYGFAVKYQVGGIDKVYTLYSTNRYSLLNLVQN